MKRQKASLPKLPRVSEQMKAWSAALAGEIGDWPQVSVRSFFGFTALYRKNRMFAALPRSRALETANSLFFKLEVEASAVRSRLTQDRRVRIWSTTRRKPRWFAFELSCDADLHDALDWLGLAYDASGKKKKLP
jgi:hypothetical protein